MYISKNKFNRWQISLKDKDQYGNEIKDDVGNPLYAHMNVTFKRGTEPEQDELSEYGSYEITEMWAFDKKGKKRKAFILPNIYKDNQGVWRKDVKLVFGDWEFTTSTEDDAQSIWHDGEIDTTVFGNEKKTEAEPIKPADLPFY